MNRPPTPAFTEFREPTHPSGIGENTDEPGDRSISPLQNVFDDDEVIFNTVPHAAFGDDFDSSVDITPPRSKYLDSVMKNDNETPEASPGGIQWKDERPDMEYVNSGGGFEDDTVRTSIGDQDVPKEDDPHHTISQSSQHGTAHPHKSSRRAFSSTASTSAAELANMLGNINLSSGSTSTPTKPSSERKTRDGKELKVGFSGIKKEPNYNLDSRHHPPHPIEVKIGPKASDGSVIVLTPRRANKKEKEGGFLLLWVILAKMLQSELGVSSVVTNARRSLRFMPVDLTSSPPSSNASTTSKSSPPQSTLSSKKDLSTPNRLMNNGPLSAFGPNARERVQKLLEEHGNAFVPNKVLEMPHTTATSNTSSITATSTAINLRTLSTVAGSTAINLRTLSTVAGKTGSTPVSRIRQPSAGKVSPGGVGSSPSSPFTVHSVRAVRSSNMSNASASPAVSGPGLGGMVTAKEEFGELTPRANRRM
ncbi:UNVERIFIED_CONTAM: hypothetical protein HDU68_010941 [Siphonaria sp. JEL0065]|nr:hypothetical protein HDU68_010941 [Siphonaria sp. JEL0065]